MRRCYGARTSGGGRHRASPIHRRRARAASLITALDRPAAATDARSASFTNWKLIVSAERCDHRPNTGTCMCTCLRDAGAPRNICSARPSSPAAFSHTAQTRRAALIARVDDISRRAKRLPPAANSSRAWGSAPDAIDARWARSSAPRRPTARASRAPSPRQPPFRPCEKRYGSRKPRTRVNEGKAPDGYRNKHTGLLLPRTVWASNACK